MLAVLWRYGARLTLVAACCVMIGACAQGESKQSADAKPIDAALDAFVPDACVPKVEQCNGRDDDCDSKSDEDFLTLGDTCTAGVGACAVTGKLVCKADGSGVACNAMAGDLTAEKCDAIDNDCDGKTDEGFMVGVQCDGADSDTCKEGVIMCDGAGAAVCGDITGDSFEICNGLDDDCDNMIDEGFGVGGQCDGSDSDACKEGVIVCNGAGAAVCSDTTDDSIEMCNGLDDDCDNNVDEGFNVGSQCDGGDSDACKEGVIMCNGAGAAVCSDMTSDSIEICNGLDDDCIGGIDNGFDVGASCNTGVGACNRTGQKVCNGSGTGTQCNAVAGTPGVETCGDGIDQDCNGADISCPTNDAPAGALDISAGGTFTVDLSAARDDQNDAGLYCGSVGGRDVFYKFTLPAAEVVYFETFGSNFDSVVRIYAGACTATGARQTCADDACSDRQTQGAVQLAAGSYCLVVDQYSSLQTLGASVLTFVRGGRTGTAITPITGSVTGNTTALTNQSPTSTCQPNAGGPDQGYYFMTCPAVSKIISADTCTGTTFDSILSLRKGNASSTSVACADDGGCTGALQSNLPDITVNTSGLYWFIVDGYNTQGGPFTLNYSFN